MAKTPSMSTISNSLINKIICPSRTQAFAAELSANKSRLTRLEDEGEDLGNAQPDRKDDIETRLDELRRKWGILEESTAYKEKTLFEAHKSELFTQVIILILLLLILYNDYKKKFSRLVKIWKNSLLRWSSSWNLTTTVKILRVLTLC